MKKGIWGRLAALFMVLALVMTFAATPAYAAAKKTVKKADFTTKTATIKKKATRVKKGTTKLTIKKGEGYLKFTAPSTKTYSFKFSNVKCSYGASAFVEVQTQDSYDPSYSFLTKVKTKGGKSDTLWLSIGGYTSGSGVNKRLASRTGKIKLKKGQDIYFYFYNGTRKSTCTLKIK